MTPREHVCKYCDRAFSSERTLASHMCVKKKRWLDKGTIGSTLGFRVFQVFYEKTTNAKKPKTFEQFIESKYYLSFVKFGRHLADLDPIDPDEFVDFVISNGIKLKDWTKDYVYEVYLEERMKKEPVLKAVERTLLTMENWGREHNRPYNKFFQEANINEAVYLIRSGRVSPWILYFAPSADDFFNRVSEEQVGIINQIIDANKWQVIFMTRKEDVDVVQEAVEAAQL